MGVVRRKKKIGSLVGIMCLLLCLLRIPAAAESAKTDETPVDFVLVLDCSGSMNSTDPNKLTTSAAKMFVDMLPAENARLSVVAFGNDYSENGTAYDLSRIADLQEEMQSNPLGRNQVRVARDLQDITAQEEKNAAKDCIDAAMSEDLGGQNKYTPLGYALEAACQVLEDNGTEPDSAAIILMSDGRLKGQSENDSYEEGLKSHSVDRAVDKTRAKGWPIYCMELNMDEQNGSSGQYDCKRAVYEMREHIPETPEEHVELRNATDAQTAFADIFSKFFDVEPEAVESMVIENGECSREFELDEMIAETNITMTGTAEGLEQLQDIMITDCNGQTTTYTSSVVQQNRIVTFEKQYITIKLMTPQAGLWKVTAHGTDDVEIGLYAVSIHEMDLQLTANTAEEVLAKGTTLNFTASFVYHDNPYVSATIYQQYPASLWVEGPGGGVVTMAGSDHDYSASFTFAQSGTYTVKAYVDDANLFRNGRKESGEYVFSVGNIPTEATSETIPPQTTNVGGTIEPIDCSKYFTNEDGDPLTYSVNFDQASGIQAAIDENGVLTLTAGNIAGEFEITVGAKDPMMEALAVQTFLLTAENQPMTLAEGLGDGKKVTVEFAYNADSIPEFLRKFVGVPSEAERDIFWSDYFSDPDGTPIDVQVTEEEGSDAIAMTLNETGMHVSGSKKGSAVYRVTAADISDSSISFTLLFQVKSLDAKALLWKKIRIPLFAAIGAVIVVIIILAAVFGGRKIYGIWDVSGSGYYETDRKLGSTRSGKKSKCKLDNILDDLNIPNGFGAVELAAGNNINQSVILRNLSKLDYIKYDGNSLTDTSKIKKLVINNGQSVTLEKDGISVTLERH
ncbi:MAG: vWA domain-containing protein [Lachnospiraceae bacterium]|nr:vWA domain-containing protein [Lachnospiraceae bacterium]